MKTKTFVKRITAVILFFTPALWTTAAVTSTYYTNIDGTSGADLFNALHVVSKVGFSSLSYDGLWTAYQTTDLNSDGKIWDMYGGCDFTYSTDQCGNYTNECDCYNREHSIPKSWFGGATSSPGSDIFHIVPTDGKVNGMRSNYAFGEVTSATYSYNGNQLGSTATITTTNTIAGSSVTVTCPSTTVFEPIDAYKGDFARGYMGTMVRWAGDYQAFTTGDGASMFSGTYTAAGYYGFTQYGVALLMKWHREDPVSQKEIDRNNGIQETQGNRNPFIDYPCLAEYLWGNKAGETVDLASLIGSFEAAFTVGSCDGCAVTDPYLNSIGSQTFSSTPSVPNSVAITVKGGNLTGDLTLSVSGTDAALFTGIPTTVSQADATSGKQITIVYTPTAVGTHSAMLSISGGGLTSPVSVPLGGTCTAAGGGDIPNLSGTDTPKIVIGVPVTETLTLASGVTSKTLYLQVENLVGDITITLTNVTGGFSVNKSSVTKAEATNGTNFVISRTGTGGATLTLGGAIEKTITLVGE